MIYLDNGATSFPKPRGMIKEMTDCLLNYCGNPGRSGHNVSIFAGEKIYQARKDIGRLFNISDSSRILFTNNTTAALNLGLKGLLKSGDHVITTAMEHNSVLRPLKALEKMSIETSIVSCSEEGFIDVAKIEREIKSNTKLILCTHASNVTGTILPIEKIGDMVKKHGLLFMVDGAQTAGHIPIDVEKIKIDLLALPGHKGLLGPQGTGMLYVNPDVELHPTLFGGTGTNSTDLNQPLDFPEGYEAGTLNVPGIVGLGYSARYIAKLGVESIGRQEGYLVEALDSELRNMRNLNVYGPEDCSKKAGIVTFNIINMSCEEVCDQLNNEFGVCARGGYHCAPLAHKTIGTYHTGAVRLSVGPFNTMQDIRIALRGIYQVQKSMI